ncbi:MAG TPA: DUF1844 domain-containing protein [Candidatus Hydrogenedentes bacterium]|nr:DUF1844 domain-containing protein [Candidatus Hydrogenedentota bacterium]HNT88187.1 DUF1844 domain-containing protein [Candidatus Hydrogenedentota bacterium]
MAEESPEIIVDQDWKARVQREKAEAQARQQGEAQPSEEEAAAPPAEAASFMTLVSSLAAQTMFALGVIAPRGTQEVVIDLDEAKYSIDLLMILRDKTKGNLTPQESGRLTATIAELQQVYVARVQQMHESALEGGPIHPRDLKQP